MDTLLGWLAAVGSTALLWSFVAFVAINGVAALVFANRRERSLVNRWTGPLLAANIVLAGTGIAVPLACFGARAVISAVTPSTIRTDRESSREAIIVAPNSAPQPFGR